jgi:DNA-binding transcriptional LysR family regulator
LEIRVAGSSELLHAWQDGHLDLALSATGNSDTGTIGHAPACWIGAAKLARDELVPLVLLPEPCAFRAMALQALTRSGVQYRIAAETPNLASLYAAISAGLGITCRPRALSGADEGEVIEDTALPALPEVNYVLNHAAETGTPSAILAEMFCAAFARPRTPASSRRSAGGRLRA